MGADFEIVEGFANTAIYVDEVRAAADTNKAALGFLQASVYGQFAQRDGLYVLLEVRGDIRRYAGHLLFDRRYPRAHVRQMFVAPHHRKHGCATLLLDKLKESLTAHGFISIYARVAEDLVVANSFWQAQSFYVQRTEKGGKTTNRQIKVRVHELESPQLFPRSGLSRDNPLGLKVPASEDLPVFLLDLNVLFDINPRRYRREEAIALFQAEKMSVCRLAISTEIRSELNRSAFRERQTDPMAAYLDIFPCFPIAEGEECELLKSELAEIVFPEAARADLNSNQVSDLRHVITAITNKLGGLITNDAAILSVASKIEQRFGVLLLSPAAFQLRKDAVDQDEIYEMPVGASLYFQQVSPQQEAGVRSLLDKVGVTGSAIASGWLPADASGRVACKFAVWDEANCLGYVTWAAWAHSGIVTVRAAVDESHESAIDVARALLMQVIERISVGGSRQIKLDLPGRQSNLREVATGLGFSSAGQDSSLIKSMLCRFVTKKSWGSARLELANAGGPRLPIAPPLFRSVDQNIELHAPDGNKINLTLDQIETLLAPAIFYLPGRNAVITPVRVEYSEDLLGHSQQMSLLPASSSALFHRKLFYSDPKALKHFKPGVLVLFYESGKGNGRSEVVAIGRVRHAYLKQCDALTVSDFKPSVLDEERVRMIGMSDTKTVTVFDNLFVLKRAVPFSFLKAIGCGRPNDVITTRPVSECHVEKIIAEAFDRE